MSDNEELTPEQKLLLEPTFQTVVHDLPNDLVGVTFVMHRKHLVVALVNNDVMRGNTWAKCPNCGKVFKGFSTLCSETCELEYIKYMQEEVG